LVESDVHGVHLPVMLEACVEGLAIRSDGIYVDGTFGRGGHSARILAMLGKAGRLVAIDRDPEAVAAGRGWGDPRFCIEQSRFSAFGGVLDACGIERVDGVLLDLGVSSPQIDDASRGFSFRADGPLDMRMDPAHGMSARQWLLQASERDIAEALRDYGEERFAVPIAKAIAARCRDAGADAFGTTRELAAFVAGIVRSRQRRPEVGKDPATRTFQALRILVNQELEELALVLDRVVDRLRPGGRMVVLSFHSLEDRMVKQFIARETGRQARRDPITGAPVHDVPPKLRSVGRVLPDATEVAVNPRARSAVLRIAERI
jgi:16S rRNA (cytosine1402-N4)-methyltransferase